MRRESTKVKTKTRGRKQIRQVRKSANPKSQSEQNLRCRVFSDWDWRICRPFSHPQCRTLRCTQVCLKLSVTLKRKDRNRSDESANPPIPNPIRAEPPLPRLLGLGLADLGLADLPAVLPSSMADVTVFVRSLSCRPDRCANNSTKFLVFRQNCDDGFTAKQGSVCDNPQPYCRFIQFFLHDLHFMNEVRATLRSPGFRVIWGASRSRSH